MEVGRRERIEKRGGNRSVDWRFVITRVVIGASAVLTVLTVAPRISSTAARVFAWGFDFHLGSWAAARAMLREASPYVSPDPRLLFSLKSAFVTPPLMGEVAIPLAHLSFSWAIVIWNLVCLVAFAYALRLLGLRDPRMWALALLSYPLVESLWTGQAEGVFALLLAVAWRYRDESRGAVAVGLLIAAKLLAWPLLIWLVVTRRYRLSAVAFASGLLALVASWAVVGWHGLADYPRLLAADARAFEGSAHVMSITGFLMHLGAASGAAVALTILLALGLGLCVVRISRGSDFGWFSAGVAVGLLSSPLLWTHYLVVLFVLLAIGSPTSIGPWILSSVFWVGLLSGPFLARTGLVLVGIIGVVAWTVVGGPALRTSRAGATAEPAPQPT